MTVVEPPSPRADPSSVGGLSACRECRADRSSGPVHGHALPGGADGWLVVAIGLGFLAPRVETALSGAGWETSGSQSVQARQLINKNFHGLSSYALMTVIYSPTQTVNDPAFQSGDHER